MTKANARNPFGLTHRRCQVMESFVRLGDTKQVARELGVTYSTVDEHLLEVVCRMRVRNRVQAAVKWDRMVREETEFHGERTRSMSEVAANETRKAA